MSAAIAVPIVLLLGVALTWGAIRATATVQRGRSFLRWMIVVFVVYLAMLSLPMAMGL